MKKSLTAEQFQAAIAGMDISARTLEIARGVLVEGKPQRHYVRTLQLTRGAVSQAVNKVWRQAQRQIDGYEQVIAVLPKHQAFIVKRWAEEAKRKE